MNGECDAALAGGVSIIFPQNQGYYWSEGGILSRDGRCRSFDEQGAGTIFGSGLGVVVLQRLTDLRADAGLPKGKTVVLGLVTTKFGEMEDKEELISRIEAAAKYVPLEQLALSPQCGFASTEEGNLLAEEEQWAKLRMIVELADEVWGK